jgi:RecJ-like exonuclease
MTDDEAVSLAAGRVRRGNVDGALALLVHQGKNPQLVNCPVCAGAGEIVQCANDGRCGCSHTYDKTWKCTACRGEGEVTPDRAAELVATSDVEP